MHGLRAIVRPIIAAMSDYTRRWGRACDTDRIGAIAFQAILAGNLAHLPYRCADGGGSGVDLPDPQRQPVSALSLAASTGIPYDQVRTRVARLVENGLLRRSAAGIVVPAIALSRPALLAEQVGDRQVIAGIVHILLTLGQPLVTGVTVATVDALPPALAARLFLDFYLRGVETLPGMHGDFVNGAILAGIASANVEHLVADPLLGNRYADHDVPPPDTLRRPIALRALARAIDIPFETVRRRVNVLVASGDIVGSEAGYLMPAAVLAQSRFRENNNNIVRQFRRLLDDVVRCSQAR